MQAQAQISLPLQLVQSGKLFLNVPMYWLVLIDVVAGFLRNRQTCCPRGEAQYRRLEPDARRQQQPKHLAPTSSQNGGEDPSGSATILTKPQRGNVHNTNVRRVQPLHQLPSQPAVRLDATAERLRLVPERRSALAAHVPTPADAKPPAGGPNPIPSRKPNQPLGPDGRQLEQTQPVTPPRNVPGSQEGPSAKLHANPQRRASTRGLSAVQVQRGLPLPALRLQGAPDPLPLSATGLRLQLLRQDQIRAAHGPTRAPRHADGRRLPAVPRQRGLRPAGLRLHRQLGQHAEQGVPLPLSQVRLRVHRHQQGGGAQAAAPEARLDPGGRVREVHAQPALQGAELPAQRQADALPLSAVPVRGVGACADERPQVQAHGGLICT